jgi:hypothetical protein
MTNKTTNQNAHIIRRIEAAALTMAIFTFDLKAAIMRI